MRTQPTISNYLEHTPRQLLRKQEPMAQTLTIPSPLNHSHIPKQSEASPGYPCHCNKGRNETKQKHSSKQEGGKKRKENIHFLHEIDRGCYPYEMNTQCVMRVTDSQPTERDDRSLNPSPRNPLGPQISTNGKQAITGVP